MITQTYNRRTYKAYIPSGYIAGKSTMLLVMLHGCTQTPDMFAAATRMNEHAEQHSFIVIYPEQPRLVDPMRCWHWYALKNQYRDQGEPALIVGMVDHMKQHYSIDEERVYVAGISAGAAMSIILSITYPDVFAAVAVCCGVPYQAAKSAAGGLSAMLRGGPDPTIAAKSACNTMEQQSRFVPLILFQGTADRSVHPRNADHIVAQWLHIYHHCNHFARDPIHAEQHELGKHTRQGVVTHGKSYRVESYQDEQGNVLIQKYLIQRMPHAWPGGVANLSHTDSLAPNASKLLVEFFAQHTLSGVPYEPVLHVLETGAAKTPQLPQHRHWWQQVKQFGGCIRNRAMRLVNRVFGKK